MKIPTEIKKALDQSNGFILLIKGEAGTGKTTLALEILTQIPNPIYLTTRVTPKFLYHQFPWVKDVLPSSSVIDTTSFDFNQQITFSTEQDFLRSLDLKNLPDFLRALRAKMNKNEKGTVIIDAWDAIATLSEIRYGKSHTLLSNYIIELVRENNFNLILILETAGDSYLDYLVDGIVCLSKLPYDNDIIIRQLHLNKLRGQEIERQSYLFTLTKGRFQALAYLRTPDFKPAKLPLVEEKPPFYSSGTADLDKLFDGGLTKGCVNLIEVAPYLNIINAALLVKMTYHFISHGRGVIGVPPPGRNYLDMVKFLRASIADEEIVNRHLRVILTGGTTLNDPVYQTLNPNSSLDFFKSIIDISKELAESVKVPIFIAASIEYLPFTYDLKTFIGEIPKIITNLKDTENITFLTVVKGNPVINNLMHDTNSHINIDEIDNQPVIYAKNPNSNLFAINLLNSDGILDISFTPIV